jgi:hypothetical protein
LSDVGYLIAGVEVLLVVGLIALVHHRAVATPPDVTALPLPSPPSQVLTPLDLKELTEMEQAYLKVMER